MSHQRLLVALLMCLPALRVARADDPPAAGEEDPSKREARALLREGVRLLGTGDNAGALALFRSAYKLFPSSKILLNIGSALNKLGNLAEAANTYQRYLDAPDADPAKRTEVQNQLTVLDAKLVKLTIEVDAADAEVFVDGAWQPVATTKLVRFVPGRYELKARKAGSLDAVDHGELAAGASAMVKLRLAPAAVPQPIVHPPVVVAAVTPPEPAMKVTAAVVEQRAPRVGALLHAVIDAKGRGGAALAGALFDLHDRIELQGGALVGPTMGAYLGAVGYITSGSLRPLIAAGAPVFFSSGTHVGVRGSIGVEWRASVHLAVVAELGVEHYFNPDSDIDATAIEPSIGVNGRL